jgi:heme a synthase
MSSAETYAWSPPRWLRYWAGGTLALLFALLTLGAVVTSFRVGMADPIWPTRPWHLFTINWSEPKAGFLVEHAHRLTGFVVGGAVVILAAALWLTERRTLRLGGFAALIALVAAFGQLHGTLIGQQTQYKAALESVTSIDQIVEPPQPQWLLAAGPTVIALAVLAGFVLAALRLGSPGRGVRALAVLLLVGVMAQGMLGGLRVYLDALLGSSLAMIHGISSQIVLAIAVLVFVSLGRPRVVPADDRMHHELAARRMALVTALLVFCQIIAGAILRHTTSPLGPRLHLLLAFAVFAAVILTSRLLGDAPQNIRRLKTLLHAVVGLQILLGIEAWVIKYAYGFSTTAIQPITLGDAIVRTAHTIIGYLLFAVSVALAANLSANRFIASRSLSPTDFAELEPVT